MHEFRHDALHSGTGKPGKKGPKVSDRKQAIAMALSEAGQSRGKGKEAATAQKAYLPIMPLAQPSPNVPTDIQQVHTGVMVALMVPGGLGQAIAVPGGEPVEDLHLTLAYLGNSDDFPQENLRLVQDALDEFYRTAKPITGEISGVGLFNTLESNNTNPFYASFDSPDLAAFRATLLNSLSMHGIDPVNNHGFTPHITLAYIPKSSPLPAVPVPQIPITFDAVTLCWGDQRFDYILDQTSLKPGEVDGYVNTFDKGLDATSKEKLLETLKANYKERAMGKPNPNPKPKEVDVTVATPTSTSFKVYTDQRGSPRWVLFSSSGFRDRDGEFVTTKALGDCVDRSYLLHQDHNFGPLRWWHMPGWDIGTCDYRAMVGSILVESGTFKSVAIGEAVARYNEKKSLGASIGFFNTGTDAEGAYNYIETFERSLLPAPKASNWLTRLFISKNKKETKMAKLSEKARELIELLGNDEQAISDVNDIIRQAKETQDAARAAGHSLKAAKPPVAANSDSGASDPTAPTPVGGGGSDDGMIDDPEDLEDGGADEDLEDGGEDPGLTAGDVPMQLHVQLEKLIDSTIKKALGPLSELLTTASSAATATKEVQDNLTSQMAQMAKAVKEANEKADKRLSDLEAQVKELVAEQPRAFNWGVGYRASQDKGTVTTEAEKKLKETQPAADPFGVTFLKELGLPVGATQPQQS
jgi:2'-5' RNA ligase